MDRARRDVKILLSEGELGAEVDQPRRKPIAADGPESRISQSGIRVTEMSRVKKVEEVRLQPQPPFFRACESVLSQGEIPVIHSGTANMTHPGITERIGQGSCEAARI